MEGRLRILERKTSEEGVDLGELWRKKRREWMRTKTQNLGYFPPSPFSSC